MEVLIRTKSCQFHDIRHHRILRIWWPLKLNIGVIVLFTNPTNSLRYDTVDGSAHVDIGFSSTTVIVTTGGGHQKASITGMNIVKRVANPRGLGRERWLEIRMRKSRAETIDVAY